MGTKTNRLEVIQKTLQALKQSDRVDQYRIARFERLLKEALIEAGKDK
jgi:hypothetical protein